MHALCFCAAEGSDWEYLGARWTVDVSNTANSEPVRSRISSCLVVLMVSGVLPRVHGVYVLCTVEWKYHGGDVARKFTRPPATEGQVSSRLLPLPARVRCQRAERLRLCVCRCRASLAMCATLSGASTPVRAARGAC